MSKERFCLDSVRADILEGTSSWTPRKTWAVTPWGWRKQGLSRNVSPGAHSLCCRHSVSIPLIDNDSTFAASIKHSKCPGCEKRSKHGYLLESWLSSSAENSRNSQTRRCSGTSHQERRINQSTSSASRARFILAAQTHIPPHPSPTTRTPFFPSIYLVISAPPSFF